MQFMIEQIALYPKDPEAAIALLSAMGLDGWTRDHVSARGIVREHQCENEADLSFNYQGLDAAKELEVLHYTRGRNWMDPGRSNFFRPRVSHLGMHCTEAALEEWRTFFAVRKIPVAQEVRTHAHTNPAIAGKRLYHYVIFDTYSILGVDIKFIVRHDPE
jgi:hypothetical protein